MSLLYTKTKIFHYTDKLDSLPQPTPEIKPPLHIRIKPTNYCNHNCCYCAYRAENLQLGKDMVNKDSIPREKMVEIIDDIIEMGVQAVTFSGGGDPFCYPHLAEVAEKLAASPIQFAALTNGSNLKGPVAKTFAQHATWLRVSMDGWDRNSYASYRNVKTGEFDKVMANMKNFKVIGGTCYLGVSFIVDKNNATHVFEFIKKLRDTGVDSVKVSPCIIDNDGEANNRYHRPFFGQVKDQVNRAKQELAGERFEIYDAYHELEEKFTKSYNWCPYLQILPVIGADMNVYSCQDKAYNLEQGLIGSIKDYRFKNFWYQNKDKFFRINPSQHCNHHCVANEKNKLVLEYLQADKQHLGFV